MKSRASDGVDIGLHTSDTTTQIPVSNLVASCPVVTVRLGCVPVKCLLDTGSMVTTITEGFFRQHFHGTPRSCLMLMD